MQYLARVFKIISKFSYLRSSPVLNPKPILNQKVAMLVKKSRSCKRGGYPSGPNKNISFLAKDVVYIGIYICRCLEVRKTALNLANLRQYQRFHIPHIQVLDIRAREIKSCHSAVSKQGRQCTINVTMGSPA
jgi:hypothetical protein